MKAAEFNEIYFNYAEKYLKPIGFKKKGTSFYLVEKDNVFVFMKNTSRGFFHGFMICFGHTFLSDFRNKKGQLKIPGYAECYPLTIDLLDIEQLTIQHDNLSEVKYNFDFISRGTKFISGSMMEQMAVLFDEKLEKTGIRVDENYIRESVLSAKQLGMNFWTQLNARITLNLLLQEKNPRIKMIEELKGAIDSH